jgi:hypothetical protein
MTPVLGLRLVWHRLEDCIRAHVLLCWLAPLLVRAGPDRMHLITSTGPAGTSRQTTEDPGGQFACLWPRAS